MPFREAADPLPLWLLPNVLSLDAPLVAVVWQDFIARAYHVELRPAARIVLFLTVWGIYILDRLLDARRKPSVGDPPRHRFARRHVRLLATLFVLVIAADTVVTFLRLRPTVLHNGVLVMAAVGLYLLAVHIGPRNRLLKAVAVAALFTAGTFLVAWTNSPAPLQTLTAPAFAMFLLALANLAGVDTEEADDEEYSAPVSGHTLALWLLGCVVLAMVVWKRGPVFFAPVALSAALLMLLHATRRRLSAEQHHVLLDAALLTPLLFRG